MIEPIPGPNWRELQRRVTAILRECGLDAEEGRTIHTARGRAEIDVYARDPSTTPPSVYLCECKLWRTRVPQGEVQTFRTVMGDSGAHFGLFISAEGFQQGAFDVAEHTNIHLVDWSGFEETFLERWCENYWVPTLRDKAGRLATYVEPPMSDAVIRFEQRQIIEPAEAVGMLVTDMWGSPFVDVLEMRRRGDQLLADAIWQHHAKYKAFLPAEAANATYLRQLLDSLLSFYERWLRETGRRA